MGKNEPTGHEIDGSFDRAGEEQKGHSRREQQMAAPGKSGKLSGEVSILGFGVGSVGGSCLNVTGQRRIKR